MTIQEATKMYRNALESERDILRQLGELGTQIGTRIADDKPTGDMYEAIEKLEDCLRRAVQHRQRCCNALIGACREAYP
jgi:hypothetical protein